MQQHIQRIQTRGHLSPDARPLKRSPKSHRQSGGEKGGPPVPVTLHADVYPQQEKQEEDNLGPDRVARGYQIEVVHRSLVAHEYDTIMKSSNARFLASNEQFSKAMALIKQIVQKKNELSIIYLDKNWLKDNMLRSLKEGIRDEFFESLATGRRLQIKDKRLSLNSSFPLFCRYPIDRLTSLSPHKVSFPLCEAMDLLYEKGVPIQKAIWFFKMNQIAHPILAVNKPKKGTFVMPCEDYASDQRLFFVRYLRCMLKEFDKAIPGQLEQNIYYQRWPYIATLIKHSFEDGMLDRHEFVNDLCDLLTEFSNFSMEQPQPFRALLILLSQFTDIITQNIFIARRVAHVLCIRLSQYKKDHERIRDTGVFKVSANECFDDLANCHHHRPTLLTIFGIIHAIVIDCPSALVWTPFEPFELAEGLQSKYKQDKSGNSRTVERESVQNSVSWLCKSPLDQLPCELNVTTEHLTTHAKAEVDQTLNVRSEEIKQRSRAIEDRWVHISSSNTRSGLDSVVESCLDILSFMDTVDLGTVDALLVLYNNIFGEENDCLDITIRVLIHWAVTVEREGSHRGLIVAHLLRMHVYFAQKDGKTLPFGHAFPSLQDLLVDCLNRDWASPTGKAAANSAVRAAEFANLMLLFYELQRFGLFNHDKYVKALVRDGTLDSRGLFLRLNLHALSVAPNGNKSLPLSADERTNRKTNSQSAAVLQSPFPAQSQPEPNIKQEPQMIISFIPMSKPTPNSSSLNTSSIENQSSNIFPSHPQGGVTSQQTSKQMEQFAKLPPQFEEDSHPFLEEPSQLSFYERFIIHLPVEQIEANRDVCNQRAIVLYGISEYRDSARQELRKIAREICKIWKKTAFELTASSHCQPVFVVHSEIRYKRRCSPEQLNELMGRFNAQTYYDQLVICGWCAESLLDSVEEFVKQAEELAQESGTGGTTQSVTVSVPTHECLDMLCTMMTICRSINSIITLCHELLPLLIHLRAFLSNHLHVDHFSASVPIQFAFVLVSHLAEHFFYFLYSPEACAIINDLYRLIEGDLCAYVRRKESGESTGWARAVSVFVYHARHQLLLSKLNVHGSGPDEVFQLLGRCEDFEAMFPSSGAGSVATNIEYQQQLADDLSRMSFSDLRTFFNQNYKRLTFSMRNDNVRYSFVIDAFKAAVCCDRSYDRLVELANFCANVSANCDLTTEWCNAIQELCYPSASSDNWKELIQEVDVTKFSTHYAIAAFTLLLASKYCFSTHGLICRLMSNVLFPLLSKQGERNEGTTMTHRKSDDFGGHDNNFCLTLYICACLVCGTDEPFQYCDNNAKSSATYVSVFAKDANKMALRIVHLVELETSIFPLLCVMMQLVDGLKRKVDARKDAVNFRIAQNYCVARCALLSICEQEWVVQRLFRLCDSHDQLQMFTNSERLRNHYVGQQLLRLSLRRKSERSTKQELIELTGDKKVYEKLLSSLSVWNIRATYYDFKLNILEQSPENQLTKTSNGNQQLASSYQMAMYQQALFNNVANACHLLFKEHLLKDNIQREELNTVQNFRLTAVNCHWLIAPLVNALPSPPPPTTGNPQNTLWCPWNSSAMKAYFLKVVADNLSTANSDGAVQYEQLLGYQPFLNLVLSCTEGEEIKQLLDSLFFYIDDIVKRVKKNAVAPYQNSFLPERDGLILRLNLISGLFDSLLANNNVDLWASAFFQMLYYEVLTYERDRDYFYTCYDMLLLLCFRIYPHKMYTNFISKFKNLRIPDELYCLQQLLPIGKSQAELSAWDSFKNVSHKPVPSMACKGSGGGSTAPQQSPTNVPNKPKIQGLIVDKQIIPLQKQLLRLLRHQHWFVKNHSSQKGDAFVSFIPRSGVVGETDNGANPFLAAPEMEQVPVLALEEKPTDMQQQQQQMIHQQQQQTMPRQQQQQNALMMEQRQQQNQQHMFTAHQQQLQQPNLITQMNVVQPPQQLQQQFSQHQQQMFQPQQQHFVSSHGLMPEGLSTIATSATGGQFLPAQQPMINILQQQASVRSGSSTPSTESPKTGAGRGGRRKNAAAASAAGTNQMQSAGAGRGQKRKKETKQPQLQHQSNVGSGTEMFQVGQQQPVGAMVPSQLGGQNAMNPTTMIIQQQQMTAQFQQQQWQQQMQRQQQQQGQQQPMLGNAMMYPAQQMPTQAAPPQPTASGHFRSQQMQPSQLHLQHIQQQFPPLHQQQQMRPNHPSQFSHAQMMQGMPQSIPAQQHQQMAQMQQQQAQIVELDQQKSKLVIHQRLKQKMQQNQQNQFNQQQHMGMPPQ